MELEKHRFLSYFPSNAAATLAAQSIVSTVSDGVIVFEEGEYPDSLYLILKGKVDLSKKTANGRYERIAQIGEGDYFGEFGVFDGLPRSARATASGLCSLAKIPRDVFLKILENVPGQAMVGLLRQIIKNLRQTNDRFIHEVVRKERMTMLSEMAEAILRDFKTSFTIIHMVCTRLRGENKAADLQELCEVVDEQLRVMSEMSEELLTFSRGAVVLARQPVPLSDVFERLAAGLKIILLEQKVRLTVEPSSEVLNADPDRLLRILRALVLKAVENFQGRGGDVTIKTSRDEETFTILIHDDGPVAAPDMNENFFEPLMTRGGMRETGVGVALAKFMVEAHGGRLFIEAKERHGTNFILRFPVDILKT